MSPSLPVKTTDLVGFQSPIVKRCDTTREPGLSDLSEWSQVAWPTVSMTASTRSGSRAPGSKTWSAPSLTACSRLAAERLVSKLDFVAAHILPYWGRVPADGAVEEAASTVEIICSVESGTVGLALERDGGFVSREVMIEARSGSQLAYLPTSAFRSSTKLSARNASALGPSRFRIEAVKLRATL